MIRSEYEPMLERRRAAIAREFDEASESGARPAGGMCPVTQGAQGLDPVQALVARLGLEGMVNTSGGLRGVLEAVAAAEAPAGWSPRERKRTELMRAAAERALADMAMAARGAHGEGS